MSCFFASMSNRSMMQKQKVIFVKFFGGVLKIAAGLE